MGEGDIEVSELHGRYEVDIGNWGLVATARASKGSAERHLEEGASVA